MSRAHALVIACCCCSAGLARADIAVDLDADADATTAAEPAPKAAIAAKVPAEATPVVRAEVRGLWNMRDDEGPAQAFDGTYSLALLSARLMVEPTLVHGVDLDTAVQLDTATWNLANPSFAALGADAVLVSVPHALPLQWMLTGPSAERLEARVRFDRLALRTHAGPVTLSVGRMAHELGIARLFPNLDVIARMPVTAPPTDYRPGIDSARLDIAGKAVTFSMIYAAAGEWADSRWGAVDRDRARMAAFLSYSTEHTRAQLLASVLRTMPFFGAGYERSAGAFSVLGEAAIGLDHDALERRPYFVLGTAGIAYHPGTALFTIEGTYFGYGASDPADYPMVLAGQRLRDEDVPFLFGTLQVAAAVRVPLYRDRVSQTTYAFVNVHDPSLYLEEQLDVTTRWGGVRVGVVVPFAKRPVEQLVPNTELAFVTPSLRVETRVTFE
jgi:hypothetical protein